jgi:hypothetical protein
MARLTEKLLPARLASSGFSSSYGNELRLPKIRVVGCGGGDAGGWEIKKRRVRDPNPSIINCISLADVCKAHIYFVFRAATDEYDKFFI